MVMLFFNSCKKDTRFAPHAPSADLLIRAKQFYSKEISAENQKYEKISSSTRTKGKSKKRAQFPPLWESATISSNTLGKNIISVPLAKHLLDNKELDYERNVVFEERNGEIVNGGITEVFGSVQSIKENGGALSKGSIDPKDINFTGSIINYDLNYKNPVGKLFKYGQQAPGEVTVSKLPNATVNKTKSLTNSKTQGEIKINKQSSSFPKTDHTMTSIERELEDGQSCEKYYLVYIEKDDYGNVTYMEVLGLLYEICSGGPVGEQPSGGETIYLDCAYEPNGLAYDSACGCIGGNTGIEACPLELKTDSLKAKFPCADKLIAQPILTSAVMKKFVEPFLTPQRPTVTYLTDNTLPWGSATTGGNFMLGNNDQDPNSVTGQSSIVRFNEKMLQNSSQLLIATTVVHETIHAYIKYNIATANNNYNAYNESNWMVGLNNFYLMGNLPANYSNHTMMLEDYFDKSITVLEAWNAKQGFIYSMKEMRMAMLYGLDVYETGTSQAQINTINAAFQAVKTKYNITTSDLNTFNMANLFSSTNKLPTTGCN